MEKRVRKNYRECWSYLKESKYHALIIAGFFIITFLIGYSAPIFFIDAIRELLKNLVDETQGMNFTQLLVFIFQNNLKAAFLGLILGFFLGLVPLFYSVTNGYILGFVSSKASEVFGSAILLRLLPHGIFELPALIISLALGLRLGTFFLSAKNKGQGLLAYLATLFSGIIIFIASLFIALAITKALGKNTPLESLLTNSLFIMLLFSLFIVSFILSVYIGSAILSKKDKSTVKENLKRNFEYSLKVFLMIVLPLLLVAGIIESLLIIFLG